MPMVTKCCAQCGAEFKVYPSEDFRKFCGRPCFRVHRRQTTSRSCARCGAEFRPRAGRPDAIYCGVACGRRTKPVSPKPVIDCGSCGEPFEIWPHQIGSRLFCSRKCGYAGRSTPGIPRTGTMERCETCDSEFYVKLCERGVRRYCSRACGAIGRATSSVLTCEVCSIQFRVGLCRTRLGTVRFCSRTCMGVANRTATPEIRRQQLRSAANRRRARRNGVDCEVYTLSEIAERDGWRCQLCRKKVNPRWRHPDRRAASIDHIIPLSDVGPDVRANVQLAHFGCNVRKHVNTMPGGEQLRLIG